MPAFLSGFPLESVEEKTRWLRDRRDVTSQQATSEVTGSGPGGIPGVCSGRQSGRRCCHQKAGSGIGLSAGEHREFDFDDAEDRQPGSL